jgi:hypothetical protein
LALTETYQRSSQLPAGAESVDPASFLVAHQKRVSAEQLMWSMMQATGELENYLAKAQAPPPEEEPAGDAKKKKVTIRGARDKPDDMRQKFVKAFGNQPQDPEVECNPSLEAALFLLNDSTVLNWLKPSGDNLMGRLSKLNEPDKVADELYLTILSRQPSGDEKAVVAGYLEKNSSRRDKALLHLAWSLLASTEFCVNH